MLSLERQNMILKILHEKKILNNDDLSALLGVSIATVRRDLGVLEDMNLIKRIHGGAVAPGNKGEFGASSQRFFVTRMESMQSQKKAIAASAEGFIDDGETIFLGMGTTTLEIAKLIKKRSSLTVLTNSLAVLNELCESGITLYSLGGLLMSSEQAFLGNLTIDSIRDFFVSKAFIGVGGFTLDNGISFFNHDCMLLNNAITQRAKHSILVTDSSKFGINAFTVAGDFGNFNSIITDSGIPIEYEKAILGMNINLVIV
jgi:DeoR/GlpR family transcriptional regulator of sugar metabolism